VAPGIEDTPLTPEPALGVSTWNASIEGESQALARAAATFRLTSTRALVEPKERARLWAEMVGAVTPARVPGRGTGTVWAVRSF
jgi:hypothetical protein